MAPRIKLKVDPAKNPRIPDGFQICPDDPNFCFDPNQRLDDGSPIRFKIGKDYRTGLSQESATNRERRYKARTKAAKDAAAEAAAAERLEQARLEAEKATARALLDAKISSLQQDREKLQPVKGARATLTKKEAEAKAKVKEEVKWFQCDEGLYDVQVVRKVGDEWERYCSEQSSFIGSVCTTLFGGQKTGLIGALQ